LKTLPRELADLVARHLVVADQAKDPNVAYEHAVAARKLAARVGAVREVCGTAAYLAGRWADALSELRAARRLTGRQGYLALMADCERALGRPDRALALVTGPEAAAVGRAEWVELRIVESGIRRDMGAAAAAAVVLQLPELTDGRLRPWSARLYYAYADALLELGRADEARDWFGRSAAADSDGETDAAERFDELDDVTIEDLEDPDPGDVYPGDVYPDNDSTSDDSTSDDADANPGEYAWADADGADTWHAGSADSSGADSSGTDSPNPDYSGSVDSGSVDSNGADSNGADF
jgi:tetratricopeptide (TPR) repeat protein